MSVGIVRAFGVAISGFGRDGLWAFWAAPRLGGIAASAG